MSDLRYLLPLVLIDPALRVIAQVTDERPTMGDYAITTVIVLMVVGLWGALRR